MNPADKAYMDMALALGRRGLGNAWPNPSVGCVIVKDGVIAGRGWTAPGGRPHAEFVAIEKAGAKAKGATLYVTLEPCSHYGQTPPCSEAIVNAGLARVVCSLEDPDPRVAGRGFAQLLEAGIEVETGLGADAARRDMAGHLSRIRRGRPHLRLKLAISKNQKIAGKGGAQIWITGKQAREQVHVMRAQADAIMVGSGTVLADDPDLTCRLPGLEERSPVRIIVDSNLDTDMDANLFKTARRHPVWVLTSENAPESRAEKLAGLGVEVIRCCETPDGRVDLSCGLEHLSKRGVTNLLAEGGAKLAASLLENDLVDEAAFFIAPKNIDEEGVDALYGRPLGSVTSSPDFTCLASQAIGPDTLFTYVRNG